MAELTIESLGISKEELIERVVDRITESVMATKVRDFDGYEEDADSPFAKHLHKAVRKKVDETIDALAQKHVLPNVAQYIETLTLQETNQWGEKKGKSFTFVEYLIDRAEHYLLEKVDYRGKAKSDGEYNWSPNQTRLTHLIHEHLQYSISTAMKDALKTANAQIVKGLEEACKLQLGEIAKKLKVQVTA